MKQRQIAHGSLFVCSEDCNVCNCDPFEMADQEEWLRRIRPGSVVLDLGAHAGLYSVISAEKGARCYSFEVEEKSFFALQLNARFYGYDKIAPFKYGAWDVWEDIEVMRRGFAMNWVRRKVSESGVDKMGHGDMNSVSQGWVKAGPIQSMFSESFVVDAIKLDVEGSEYRALLGMRDLIARSPKIAMMVEFSESHSEVIGGVSLEQLWDLIILMGFKPVAFSKQDLSIIVGLNFRNLFFTKGYE